MTKISDTCSRLSTKTSIWRNKWNETLQVQPDVSQYRHVSTLIIIHCRYADNLLAGAAPHVARKKGNEVASTSVVLLFVVMVTHREKTVQHTKENSVVTITTNLADV